MLHSRHEAAAILIETGCPLLIEDPTALNGYDLNFSPLPSSDCDSSSSLIKKLSSIRPDIREAADAGRRLKEASMRASESIRLLCLAVDNRKDADKDQRVDEQNKVPIAALARKNPLVTVNNGGGEVGGGARQYILPSKSARQYILPSKPQSEDWTEDPSKRQKSSEWQSDPSSKAPLGPNRQEVIVLDEEIEAGEFYNDPPPPPPSAPPRPSLLQLHPMTRPSFEPPRSSISLPPALNNPLLNSNLNSSISGAGGGGGFKTARDQLKVDMAKKGQSFDAVYGTGGGGGGGGGFNGNNQNQAPRVAGLSKKRPLHSNPYPNQGGQARGPVPGFVNKALGASGGNQNDATEDPSSIYTEQVLGVIQTSDGSVHEEILKLDPKIVEMVCNEVLDSKEVKVTWEDIAGQASDLDWLNGLSANTIPIVFIGDGKAADPRDRGMANAESRFVQRAQITPKRNSSLWPTRHWQDTDWEGEFFAVACSALTVNLSPTVRRSLATSMGPSFPSLRHP